MANETGRDRDLVLAPGEFAFILDTTKGLVNVIVGPNKISMSNTDQPVVWDKTAKRFTRCGIDAAIQINTIAPEGFYIALYNPAVDGKNPRDGASSVSVPLNVGHRINIPGPVNFPLWPGQMSTVFQGHHLRSNQYLLAQVYNDLEATTHWSSAILKTPEGGNPATVVEPRIFAPGQQIIIKGTDVAFFIPPTGIKVVPENGKVYIREAVTLERLEYCILLDEDGNKRFVQGPDVVFPEPTEQFIMKDGGRKFRAIELNETTGIYIKVIADYKDGDKEYKVGDELFITGKEQAIYFQREEHSVIRYGEQTKHYAVAMPAGEGRYVLNRNTGVVSLVKGPKMLLCDPRFEVIIRRVISEATLRFWYPNNERVIQVNQALELLNKKEDASQYARGTNVSYAASLSDTSTLSSKQIAGDVFNRSQSFTPPRTITLDTKYEGAVAISVWTGYAVLVINKTGGRRVVIGPEVFLLEYDETLAQLELSTGTPKVDTKFLKTVYLRIHNNKISDLINIETKDLVRVKVTLSYRVNFEGDDPNQWFEVENYVRLLSDHMRSLIRNTTKRKTIEEFYANAIDIIRDAILGPVNEPGHPRLGRLFSENNMRVYDVEVLDVVIGDADVANLLLEAQSDALKATILIAKQSRALEVTQTIERINRDVAIAKNQTILSASALSKLEIDAKFIVETRRIVIDAEAEKLKLDNKIVQQEILNALNEAAIARQKAIDEQKLDVQKNIVDLDLQRVTGETDQIVKRAAAISPTLAAALVTFSDQALVQSISTTLAPMALMSGVSAADVLSQLFRGTPMEGVMKQLGTRSTMRISGDIK